MEINNKDFVVKQFPLFADLSRKERELIKERLSITEYKKGQVIYEEGSAASAFYCIVLGRVVLFTSDKKGNHTILEYLHHGKYFGIISLLTNEPHSVTAKAVNDSTLLVIKKDDFDFILKEVPGVAIDLSRSLSRRLKNKDIHQKTIFESTMISVYSYSSQAGKSVYALNLALSLYKETCKAVIILSICPVESSHSLPKRLMVSEPYRELDLSNMFTANPGVMKEYLVKSEFGIDLVCVRYKSKDAFSAKRLLDILSFLVNDYHYIILDLTSVTDQFVLSILNQSDAVHILTGPQIRDLKKTYKLVGRLKTHFHLQESKIKVVINEYKVSKIPSVRRCELLDYKVYATLRNTELRSSYRPVLDSPESEYAKVVRRISRQVSGSLVGLALGVGVGYGFCHIGVLKVIEEENIPIDIVSGSSIGALIASLWATGRDAREILEITMEEFKHPKYTWGLIDLTFPLLGFIKGNKLYRFLKKYLGNKTFCEVRLPLKIIASDIRRKEPRVLDKGLLIDAVMASCAMPGVFQPFKLKEEILFDGGLINPLPTEILFNLGIRKIIAVNVTPSREDIARQYEKIKEELLSGDKGLKKKEWFNIKRYFQNKFKNNILDVVFSSIELMQSELIQREAQLADIILHPDTEGLHWLELYRGQEFAQRGENEARNNLERIRQVINE